MGKGVEVGVEVEEAAQVGVQAREVLGEDLVRDFSLEE